VEIGMTDLMIVLAAAVLTYLSRAAAVAILPASRGRLLSMIERLPAPLFAALAAYALVGTEVRWPDDPGITAAALAAVLVSPTRSIPWILIAGTATYLAVTLL
jgi:branched-subunit amino acid transport protein AzlD